MKNIIAIVFIAFAFNACTVTSHYQVTNDLKFKPIPKEQRKTYEFFGKEQFVKVIKENTSNEKESFFDEFSQEPEIIDPFEKYNRIVTSFNDYLFTNLLDPSARKYANVVPQEIRVGISNFFSNIKFPIRFVNNILQFKFSNALEETNRFVINSTAGILGFIDIAADHGFKTRDEDLGQTLAYYGFTDGPHIVLPIYGPSNVRDIVGSIGDGFLSPLDHAESEKIDYKIPKRFEHTIAIRTFSVLNSTSLNLGQYQNIKKDAIDLYPFIRDIYNQNRNKQIKE